MSQSQEFEDRCRAAFGREFVKRFAKEPAENREAFDATCFEFFCRGVMFQLEQERDELVKIVGAETEVLTC